MIISSFLKEVTPTYLQTLWYLSWFERILGLNKTILQEKTSFLTTKGSLWDSFFSTYVNISVITVAEFRSEAGKIYRFLDPNPQSKDYLTTCKTVLLIIIKTWAHLNDYFRLWNILLSAFLVGFVEWALDSGACQFRDPVMGYPIFQGFSPLAV